MNYKPTFTLEVGDDNCVYVRGCNSGSTLCGKTVEHVAKWNGAGWSALEIKSNGTIYVGGAFSSGFAPTDSPKHHHNDEWQCNYCGRPNHRHDETCKSCGAPRSFIYD